MGRFRQTIANQDLFGHVIHLNFNRQGDAHKTPIGGIFSIIVKIAMAIYIFVKVKAMLFFEDDTNFTEYSSSNLMALGEVPLSTTGLVIFHLIQSEYTGNLVIDQNDSLERYISYRYVQLEIDYTKPFNQHIMIEVQKARECRLEDFGDTEKDKELFNTWQGIPIICADQPSKMNLYNDLGSMHMKTVRFEILRCSNASRMEEVGEADCHSKDEIDQFIHGIDVQPWGHGQKMDFKKREGKPVFIFENQFGSTMLKKDISSSIIFFLQQNLIETEDSFLQLGQKTQTGQFYNIEGTMLKESVRDFDNGILYSTEITLHNERALHTRKIYGFFDLLGDFGGVTEVIMLAFGFFLYPISQHSFILKASRKLFLARTNDQRLFSNSFPPRKVPQSDSNRYRSEISKHKRIAIALTDSIRLYIFNKLGSWLCCLGRAWRKRKKLQRLYSVGSNRIEQELNIVKIMKDLRNLNILMKNSLMSQQVKAKLEHSGKNIIDLDASSLSSSSSKVSSDSCEGCIELSQDTSTIPNDNLKRLRSLEVEQPRKRPESLPPPRPYLDHNSILENIETSMLRKWRLWPLHRSQRSEEEAAIIIQRWWVHQRAKLHSWKSNELTFVHSSSLQASPEGEDPGVPGIPSIGDLEDAFKSITTDADLVPQKVKRSYHP